MLVIEFVNHIELLLWIIGKMTYCVLSNNTECIDALEVSALCSPAFHDQPSAHFPKEKNMTAIFKNPPQP